MKVPLNRFENSALEKFNSFRFRQGKNKNQEIVEDIHKCTEFIFKAVCIKEYKRNENDYAIGKPLKFLDSNDFFYEKNEDNYAGKSPKHKKIRALAKAIFETGNPVKHEDESKSNKEVSTAVASISEILEWYFTKINDLSNIELTDEQKKIIDSILQSDPIEYSIRTEPLTVENKQGLETEQLNRFIEAVNRLESIDGVQKSVDDIKNSLLTLTENMSRLKESNLSAHSKNRKELENKAKTIESYESLIDDLVDKLEKVTYENKNIHANYQPPSSETEEILRKAKTETESYKNFIAELEDYRNEFSKIKEETKRVISVLKKEYYNKIIIGFISVTAITVIILFLKVFDPRIGGGGGESPDSTNAVQDTVRFTDEILKEEIKNSIISLLGKDDSMLETKILRSYFDKESRIFRIQSNGTPFGPFTANKFLDEVIISRFLKEFKISRIDLHPITKKVSTLEYQRKILLEETSDISIQ